MNARFELRESPLTKDFDATTRKGKLVEYVEVQQGVDVLHRQATLQDRSTFRSEWLAFAALHPERYPKPELAPKESGAVPKPKPKPAVAPAPSTATSTAAPASPTRTRK